MQISIDPGRHSFDGYGKLAHPIADELFGHEFAGILALGHGRFIALQVWLLWSLESCLMAALANVSAWVLLEDNSLMLNGPNVLLQSVMNLIRGLMKSQRWFCRNFAL